MCLTLIGLRSVRPRALGITTASNLAFEIVLLLVIQQLMSRVVRILLTDVPHHVLQNVSFANA